ncbi:MAG: hypothetical protein ABW022_11780 [Actinoplanes sp.]
MEDLVVDEADIQTAFDDVFDQAILFHGFADYLRDYDVSSTRPPTRVPHRRTALAVSVQVLHSRRRGVRCQAAGLA